MKEGETLIIMGIFSLLMILYGILIFFCNKSLKSKYIFLQKLKNINKRKTFKYWIIIQGMVLFASMGKENMMAWYEIIGFPIFVMIFIILNALSISNTSDEYYDMLKTDEYKDYEKAFIRDEKLKKILKKSIF